MGKRLFAILVSVLMLMSIISVFPANAESYVYTYDFRDEQRAFNRAYYGNNTDAPPQPPDNLEIGIEMSEAQYDNLTFSDDMRASYCYEPFVGEEKFEFQRFKFKIFEPVSSISQIYVEHEGYGLMDGGPGHALYIWNYSNPGWQLGVNSTISSGDQKLSHVYTDGLSDYIGPDGYLQLLVMPWYRTSCPFLYAWDGSSFKFITDINNEGGLGYDDATGSYDYKKPNPKDYTKIDGSQLIPDDGYYLIEIAEDQNEVTYLDAAGLLVVDHSPGLEVYSNILDTYSPEVIPFTIHTVANPQPPVSAVDGDGKNILPVILEIDREYTEVNLFSYDNITLDLGDLSGAGQIKLLYNAFIEWPQGPDFSKPHDDNLNYVEVINEIGEWEIVPFELGLPREWPQTVVLDITDWFKTDDYRLRIHNWHRVHIDYIAVDTSEDEVVSTTEVDPVSAELHWKGVSVQSSIDGKHPLSPDYYTVTGLEGYSLYEGNFTRYGDVLPLVTDVDDKFVIMHVGDSVSLTFNEVPIPEGMERDYFLVSDAYFKENFVRYLLGQGTSNVEPLPFHGMTTYPYPAGESYPYDAEHIAYLNAYNTRKFPGIEQHNTIYTDYVKVDVYAERPARATIDSHWADTPPRIDGQYSPSEWKDPQLELCIEDGFQIHTFVCVMNDAHNLYILVDAASGPMGDYSEDPEDHCTVMFHNPVDDVLAIIIVGGGILSVEGGIADMSEPIAYAGFGTSPNSPPGDLGHRIYEFKIPLSWLTVTVTGTDWVHFASPPTEFDSLPWDYNGGYPRVNFYPLGVKPFDMENPEYDSWAIIKLAPLPPVGGEIATVSALALIPWIAIAFAALALGYILIRKKPILH